MLGGLAIGIIALIYFNWGNISDFFNIGATRERLRLHVSRIGLIDAVLALAGAKFAHVAYSVPAEYFDEIPSKSFAGIYMAERMTFFAALIACVVCFSAAYFVHSRRAKANG